MDPCPEKNELNHPRAPTFTLACTKKNNKEQIHNIWASDLKLTNSAVFLYREILFQLHVKFDRFYFFPLNVAVFFFHTLVKHGHRAPDYRLQNHIHTVLSKETHRHGCSQGSRGGPSRVIKDPLSFAQADNISRFFSSFFLAKLN